MTEASRPPASVTSGILLVDKPQGLTSHDVVSRTRKAAGTRKVGHAGTLDPMATGLLVLGLNSSTRLLTYLVGLDKEYFATIRLGQSTTTDDAEGETVTSHTVTSHTVAEVTETMILAGVLALTGEISQIPSSVSAIKVDGKRAYKRARAGETTEELDIRVEIEQTDDEVGAPSEPGDVTGPPESVLEADLLTRHDLAIPDDPTVLSYLLSGIVQVELPRRQALLEAETTVQRLQGLIGLLDRELLLLGGRLRCFTPDARLPGGPRRS